MIRNLIGEAVGLVFTWVAAVAGLVLLGYGVSQIVVWARSAWPVILDIFVKEGPAMGSRALPWVREPMQT